MPPAARYKGADLSLAGCGTSATGDPRVCASPFPSSIPSKVMTPMNRPQRRLLICALTALAAGLHVWFCEWGWGGCGDPALVVLYRHDSVAPHEAVPKVVLRDAVQQGSDTQSDAGQAEEQDPEMSALVTRIVRAHGNLALAREQAISMLESRRRDPVMARLKEELWFAKLSPQAEEPTCFALRAAVDRDEALLWGIIAPICVLGVAVFLILGWRGERKGGAPPPQG